MDGICCCCYFFNFSDLKVRTALCETSHCGSNLKAARFKKNYAMTSINCWRKGKKTNIIFYFYDAYSSLA